MITKNFKVFASTMRGRIYTGEETISIPVKVKDVTGNEYSSFYFITATPRLFGVDSNKATNLASTQSGTSTQLFVGTNGNEPTENDYTINDIETLSAVDSTTIVRTMDGDGYAITITRTLQNTADSDITIKEIGLVKNTPITKSNSAKFLFAREVLPTPLVVPSGNSFTVSMVVKI